MLFDPQIHHRHSIRLKGYDYNQAGAYFITLVAWQRICLFGSIQDNKVVLSEMGKTINVCWSKLPNTFNIQLDDWVIMPNHFHGILYIQDSSKGEATARSDYQESQFFPAVASPRQRPIGTKSGSLGAILQNFKSMSARKINQLRGSPGLPVWQRNYYERIIRNETEWEKIRLYIQQNPAQWTEDIDYQ